jgi:hypothetical protein
MAKDQKKLKRLPVAKGRKKLDRPPVIEAAIEQERPPVRSQFDIWDRAMYVRLRDRDIDLDVTFLIWQGMVLHTTGVKVDRSHFDEAMRAWKRCPRNVPLVTIAMDAEAAVDIAVCDEWRASTKLAA